MTDLSAERRKPIAEKVLIGGDDPEAVPVPLRIGSEAMASMCPAMS